MRRPLPCRAPRGAALPLSLILLAVLTVIAVAAVSLSGQERVNAASYSKVDFINQCANAAQAKIWSELAYQGTAYLTAPVAVTSVRLPGGAVIRSPAHYDCSGPTPPPYCSGATTLVKDVVLQVKSGGGGTGAGGSSAGRGDMTNQAAGMIQLGTGDTQLIIAHCVDAQGRALEIEIGVRFAL